MDTSVERNDDDDEVEGRRKEVAPVGRRVR